MAMKDPVHPGAIVREDCLSPLDLSVTEGAKRLGVGRQTLSNLVNEKVSVSIEMAYRLSKAFGSTPETWLGMQRGSFSNRRQMITSHRILSRKMETSAIIERETFDAVQRLLDSKTAERRSATNANAPSLLTGLVYDGTGDRLSPTHAIKKGRRYRYYISKRLVLRISSTEDGWRLPAKELDRAVTQMIGDFLRDEIRFVNALDLIGTAPDRMRTILRRAAAVADDLGREPPEPKRRLLHRLLHRVTVHNGSIHIAFKRSSLGGMVFGMTPDRAAYSEDPIEFAVPTILKRRGVEAKLVVSTAQGEIAAPDENSIAMLVRAHRWLDPLAKGEIGSAREISRSEKIDASEISRIIRLAFLAPDIIEAVLAGHQPVELTPRCLMRGEIPHEWHRQRRLLGFPA